MDEFELEIKEAFIEEAQENLVAAENAFMSLETSSDPTTLLEEIFRLAHNLKGGSRAVGFPDVAIFTHHLENLVLCIQKKEIPLTSDVVTHLLQASDRLVAMLKALKSDINSTFENCDLIDVMESLINNSGRDDSQQKIDSSIDTQSRPGSGFIEEKEVMNSSENLLLTNDLGDKLQDKPLATSASAEHDDFSEEKEFVKDTPEKQHYICQTPETQTENKPEVKRPSVNTDSTEKKISREQENEVVRVNMTRINKLNDLVGELLIAQSMVQQADHFNVNQKIKASIRHITKLAKEIQSISMSMRMLPVKPLAQKLRRVVRDTAQMVSKDIAFEVEGEFVDIDKSVLDRIGDPLTHILRNAVDHGIEDKESRVRSGKTAQGVIHLQFKASGNTLQITIEDDGAGINAQYLREKAIERGILSEGRSLTEQELLALIFHPGFSTKKQVTEVSGRGVGMDVVKTNLQQINGQIELRSELGKGTKFDIKIPLSLAVIEGVIVGCTDSRYVFPLTQIQETLSLDRFEIHNETSGIGSCIELRNQVVPVRNLEQLLGKRLKNKEIMESRKTTLIFHVNEQPVGVVVDEILKSQQIVIKPLKNGMKKTRGWIGTCVLGDGLPALVLNPCELFEHYREKGGAA